MALNLSELSELKFVVNDSDLKRASDTIGNLVTSVGKLDKAARDAAQTEVVFAKAAKLNADANLQNAKAQDVRLKSTITADKADQQAATAIEKKTKATERATVAAKRNVDMLQLQNDTYDFILEGFSKGDAKVLAMAKATGQLSDQLKQVLTDIRQFSKNTFDQTETGLDRMVKSAKEASAAQGFLNQGFNLTAKQAKELGNDLDRLNIRLQHQGKSYDEIVKARAVYKQQFLEEAKAVNQANNALATVEKQRKDVVSATNYLTQADQRMAAALNTSNAALDKAGTDSLVKYETALRKSGVSQDVATLKLAKYKAQLEQVQIQEQKRQEQHLTRALAPQATDIVVSLWSGQNPLTVLLQQGGQVTDLFMQSGVAAEKFGEVVKSSMQSMLPSILAVVKAVGGLLVDGFVAAGNAVSSFLANSVGMTGALDKLYMKMSENGPSKWGGVIRGLSTLMTGAFAVGIAVVVAGLVGLGIGLKQVIEENNELAKSFALSGASMGVSHTQVINYVRELSKSGATTGQATEALVAMAKAGKFTSEEILLVGNAAVQMQKNFGVSIEDTVKQFAKLKEKPVEALLEIAKSSGMVAPEVLKMVIELEKAGKVSDAAALAMKSYADVTKQQVSQMKENYNGFALFMIDLGQKIKQFFSDTFKVLFLATDPTKQLEGQLANTQKLINQYKSAASYSPDNALGLRVKGLEEQARMISSQISATTRLAGEESRRKQINAENAAYEEAALKLRQGAEDAIEKELRKTKTLADFRRNFVEDKLKDAARENAVDLEKLKQNKDLVSLLEKQADIEYKKMHKSGSSKSENYFATIMRQATAASIKADDATKSLTASQVNLIETVNDPRFLELSKGKQEIYLSTMAANAGKEQQIALTEAQADAEERLLKLLGKSSGIGRQYYTDMANMEKDAALLGKSREEIEELTRAIFMATPAWKAYEKALEEVNSAARKFNEDSIASQAATLKENESLDYRLSLLGKTAEEQKALSIEYNRANKLREVDIKLAKQLREIEEKIAKAKKDGLPESDYQSLIDAQVQARKDAAEQEKVINREVAVAYKEDLQKEFDAIKNGISDSIVTALFEGGKAGSKKIRDLVVAELKKPVTMVVNAVVNTVLGNIIGSLMGGTGAGGTGSLLSTAGGIGNLLGGLGSFGSTIAGGIGSAVGSVFGVGAGNVALGTSLGLGASSSTAAALAAAQAGGAAGGAGAAGMGSFLSGAGAAMPYIGAAIALISLISGMDDSGTLHTGGAASYSAATGRRNSLGFRDNEEGLPSYNPNDNIDNQFGTGFGWVERGDQTISAMEQLSKSLVEIFDGIAKSFGQTVGYEVSTAFADDTSEDGAWGGFRVALEGVEILNWDDFRTSKWAPKEFGDGEEGYKQYLAAAAQDARKILMDMDLPAWANKVLSDLGESASIESLATAVQQIGVIQSAFTSMRETLVELSGATDETMSTLMRMSGGIEALSNNASTYYQEFYSQEDQNKIAGKKLSESLSKLGFEDLDYSAENAKEQFTQLVESQDLTTHSGKEAYAGLLALSGAFAKLANASQSVFEALRQDNTNVYIEQLRLLGREEHALAIEREIATQGMTQQQIALWDATAAVKKSNEEFVKTTQLSEESTNLYIEQLKLLGENEKALAMERGIATKGMTDQQVALWDANKAAEDYNLTLKNNADLIKSINTSMPSLMKKFLSEDEWATYQTGEVAKNLVKSGIAFDDITQAIAYLNSATKDEIGQAAGQLFNMAGLSLEQKQVLMESAGIMADLKDTSSKVAEDIKKAFTKAGDDIVAYIKELTVGRAGLATPMELLDKTRQVYTQDLAAANAGDSDAAGRLVQSAKAYIDAQKTVTASSSFTNDVIKTIIGQLSGLGFVQEQLMASNAPFIPQFANGGTFDSGIVSKPTLFNIGQMGEAGPEAIMPLSRTSGGRLGVTTDNSSTNRLIAQLIVEVKALREQQSQETAGIISTNISVTEGTAQAVVDKINEKDRQVNSQPVLN